MRVSIVTACRNAGDFLENCIRSVLQQTYTDVEYIVIDGGSTDNSMEIIQRYREHITHFISEADKGIYDAMNKGIALATGDIVGILNADDFFPQSDILEKVVCRFAESGADTLYGDIWYVSRNNTEKAVRKWRSGHFRTERFQWGWMPPHPSFYVRRHLFEKYGDYDLNFGSAADYELMLRFLYKHKVTAVYLEELIVKMRTGGISNRSLQNRFKSNGNDLNAMRKNGIRYPRLAVVLKPLRKIPQLLFR